jgi:hypothetical protein
MSNTNQNFEDSGGFGQDEAESEDHEMIYTINLSKMLKLKIVVNISTYL